MADVTEFLSMGGYAAYVWSAFGFTAATMLALLWHSIAASRKREAELAHLRQELRPERKPAKAIRPVRLAEPEVAAPRTAR